MCDLENISIVHCKTPHDIYIGRPKKYQSWNFGNPFVIGVDGTRSEVIEKYRRWLLFNDTFDNKDATLSRRRWILQNLNTLKSSILGCWCDYPKEDCHGRILKNLAQNIGYPKIMAIIGTAGRKEDAAKLSLAHYNRMINAAKAVMSRESYITKIVSGGAAWADHVATEFHNTHPVEIFLPNDPDLNTLRYYHKKFSQVVGWDTFDQLIQLSKNKIQVNHNCGNFKTRNTKVAEIADIYLAMTFGDGKIVKPGGTSDTVDKIIQINPVAVGYHLDLNTLKLYKI